MAKMKILLMFYSVLCLLGATGCARAQDNPQKDSVPQVTAMELKDTKNVHASGKLVFSGQFSPDDVEAIKSAGIGRVISLRQVGEVDFDEPKSVADAGLEFARVPFASEESLTDEVFDRVRNLLRDDSKKTLLHCGSANRVGGVWLTYRVLDQGVEVSQALAEAKKIGLRVAYIENKALDYIKRQKLAAESAPAKPSGDADVTFVKATFVGEGKWTFAVTVKHPDVGWRDFANGWDVVLPDGKPILLSPKSKFTRVLGHPHVNEQPFTRSQSNIPIPEGVQTVTVRAHDLVHGYGGKIIEVKLDQATGDGFKVVR